MRVKSRPTARKSAEVVIVEIDAATAVPMSDMEKVDRHVITREEYEEIPELPRSWFESADFKIGDKLIRRGRPPKEKKKVAISIRLSEDVLEAFKFCGPGWQTRIDEALAQWLEEHPAVAPAPALKHAAPRKRAATKPVTAPAPSGRAGSKRSSQRSRQAP
ncbi:MAG: hypothetical protein JWO64_3166 [Hyphomicrobiales bacterium]|jgi:uncharacterized protein (DUF4415 family)|nr:hypothetical protein [Hyphomicrobiales bacterium]